VSNRNHWGHLFVAHRTARIVLGVVAGLDAVNQVRHEQLRKLNLHVRWDSPATPVLNALNTAARLVVAQPLGNFRGAAKGVDDLAVGMKFGVFAHGAFIKHHV